MTPERRRRLLSIGLVFGIIALALFAAALPPPATAGGSPAHRARASFVVYAFAGNQTTNATTNKTIQDLESQIALLWAYLLGGNNWIGLGPTLALVQNTQLFLVYGLVALFVMNLAGFVLVMRSMKQNLKDLREERIGPEDPNLYAVLGVLIEKVLGDEASDLIDAKAKADVLRRIRARAAERRPRVLGTAGRIGEE